jgi:hypothetical protein
LKVQYRIRKHENQPRDNHIKPHFQVVNTGPTPVKYADITLRYWYTKEGEASEVFWCDYAALGTSRVKGKFVAMDSIVAMADTYLEVSFASGASLSPGKNSGEIQTRFNKVNWSDYNEKNDYSFDPTKTNYTDWSKVTLYYKGVLIWGVEPSGSIEEPVETVLLFPNPFQTIFTIQVNGPFVYSIIDQNGILREIGKGETQATAGHRLQLPGLYHVQILHSKGLSFKRIVKE